MTVASKKMCGLMMALIFFLAACETVGPKATIGGMGGAAAGGLIGAAAGGGATGIAAGVILGGLLGSAIGDRLDAADRKRMYETTHYSLEKVPTGTTSTWQNPDNGHSGTVTPTRTYQTANGNYCREYQQTVIVGGEKQEAYGTACRQPDGSWKIVN